MSSIFKKQGFNNYMYTLCICNGWIDGWMDFISPSLQSTKSFSFCQALETDRGHCRKRTPHRYLGELKINLLGSCNFLKDFPQTEHKHGSSDFLPKVNCNCAVIAPARDTNGERKGRRRIQLTKVSFSSDKKTINLHDYRFQHKFI